MSRLTIATIDDAKKICKAANMCDADILLKHNYYVVDAASLLGIFSLDLGSPVDVEVIEHRDGEKDRFFDILANNGVFAE